MATKTLFAAQSANGASDPVTVRQDSQQVHVETVIVQVSGDLGGGTVTLQGCLDLGESPQVWTDLAGDAFSAAGIKLVDLATGTSMRASLSGSSGASVTVLARGDL